MTSFSSTKLIVVLVLVSFIALAGRPTFAVNTVMVDELNNSLDFIMANNQTYLTNPLIMSLWATSKAFLNKPLPTQYLLTYFEATQSPDGSWSGGWTPMFVTSRVLVAYYLLNATPKRSLDPFFSGYDNWTEIEQYSRGTGSGDLRNVYHVLFAWCIYYHTYPPWLNQFFSAAELDLSWTSSTDYHKRTHILYSYVIARRQFPNLDGIINATLNAQLPDGHWDYSQYAFNTPIYFESIQISLLKEIQILYPGHRTAEIQAALDRTVSWVNADYHTQTVGGKVCGYFGATPELENGVFAGILAAGQDGLISANVDMTFQGVVDLIIPEHSFLGLLGLLAVTSIVIVYIKRKRPT